jgi:iron-sulfur cluster assembly protein
MLTNHVKFMLEKNNDFAAPVRITERARYEIIDTLTANKIPDTYGLRVGLKGGGCSGTFLLGFDTVGEMDQEYRIEGVKVIIDRRHLMYVLGMVVDFEEGSYGSGFTVSSPDKVNCD